MAASTGDFDSINQLMLNGFTESAHSEWYK